jgi:hypothetical protein
VKRLAHPGIVPILDVIDDGSEVLLVFPAWFENLDDRVARLGLLAPDEVLCVGRVLLDALAAAHRQGVVHRDIKPANILFDQAGEAALSDFGIAVTTDFTAGLTPDGTVVGTPMWMAPEQARGEPAGPAGDVFSLGAALRFAATGEGPYGSGPGPALVERARRHQIRPLPTGLPVALRVPLQQMLDHRPERRPSAAAVLGGLEGTTVTRIQPARRHSVAALARRILIPEPTRPAGRARGHRKRLAAVVLAGAVTASCAGLLAAGRDNGTAIPRPHTSGKACVAGWYELDGIPADGCESHSDYVAGLALTKGAPVHANLVPPTATDSFSTHVSGDALALCWGALHVTLTAPPNTAEEVTVWKGATRLARALSADGAPATATVNKPSCFGGDSEDLTVKVTAVVTSGSATANDFTLTRDGGW